MLEAVLRVAVAENRFLRSNLPRKSLRPLKFVVFEAHRSLRVVKFVVGSSARPVECPD